jgi:hypothetical protein
MTRTKTALEIPAATQKTILNLALAGDLTGAIKLYREATGCDLHEAKTTVESWLRISAPPGTPVVAELVQPDSLDLFEGRVWNPDLVAEELVNIFSEVWHRIVYGGRMLAWAKRCLGHGDFEGWCSTKVGISERTARNWMRVARFTDEHPRLAAPMGRAGLKKALLLTSLPAEVLEHIEVTFGGPETPFDDDMFDRPYVDLKRDLNELAKKLEAAETDRSKEARRAALAERQVAELVRTPNDDVGDLVSRIHKHKASVQAAVIANMATIENLSRAFDTVDPIVQAEVVCYLEWLDAFAKSEAFRMRIIIGEQSWGDAYREVMAMSRPKTDETWDLPEGRVLPFFGEDDGAPKGGRR